MAPRRSRSDETIIRICKETGMSMYDVSRVMKCFMQETITGLDNLAQDNEPLYFGIQKLDSMVRCFPGITLVYSQSDLGKTSLLKTMALGFKRQNMMVLFLDAENKLYLHELSELDGVYFSTTVSLDAVKKLIECGAIDVLIIDTISSVATNTMKAFIAHIRKYVPFIILAAQMRVDIEKKRFVPACSDGIQSSAHTHIFLTESEKISFEGLDMRRVQFSIMKYEKDVSVERKRSGFVIRNNYVSNFWGAVDYLHSIGMIRALGQSKYLDNELVGKYRDIVNDSALVDRILELAWIEMSGNEVDYDIYRESGATLFEVQSESGEGEQVYTPSDQGEVLDLDGDRLSDH